MLPMNEYLQKWWTWLLMPDLRCQTWAFSLAMLGFLGRHAFWEQKLELLSIQGSSPSWG